jgi:uncharacterized DUF497 family protein
VWHFDWDPAKAQANFRRHGVSFGEAQTAFHDDFGLLVDDPDHSQTEERLLLIGLSSKLRVLVVVHHSDPRDRMIRISSARRATPTERAQYYWQSRK